MAALRFRAVSGAVALTGGTAMTVLQIAAPTNQRVKIQQIHVSFDGASSAAVPAAVALYRQTGGTFTASPPALVLTDKELTETIQSSLTWKATAEPTYGDKLDDRCVPAYAGSVDLFYPFGQEIIIPGGGKLGVVVNAPSAVNVRVTIQAEE